MGKKSEEDLQGILEDAVFILNEVRSEKLKGLEKTKLSVKQVEMLQGIEKDLQVVVTKLGIVLHPTEL